MGSRSAVDARYKLLEISATDRKPHGGRWLQWLLVMVVGGVLYALDNDNHYQGPHHGLVGFMVAAADSACLSKHPQAFLIDSAGCRLPALDPWNQLVKTYVEEPQPIVCDHRRAPLVASNLTSLFVSETALPDYNLTDADADAFSCCSQSIHLHEEDDSYRLDNNCYRFKREINIHDELVRVRCFAGLTQIYEDYHAFVHRKPDVEARCRSASIKSSSYEGDAPSVLLLGIRAMSRLNLHRQMPRTVELLREMGAIDMLGYATQVAA